MGMTTDRIEPKTRFGRPAGPEAGQARRRLALVGAAGAAVAVAAVLAFDWNWLRAPLEGRIAAATGHVTHIGAIDGRWRSGLRLTFRDVVIGTDVKEDDRPLQAREILLQPALLPLLRARLQFVEVGIAQARINVRRATDGSTNWVRGSGAEPAGPAGQSTGEPLWRTLRVDALQLDDVALSLRDAVTDAELQLKVATLPAGSEWRNHYAVDGRQAKIRFQGQAWTGGLLTLRDTETAFPFKGDLQVGNARSGTRVQAEGSVTDVLGDAAFDVRLAISGPSLSTLYPTLPLVLPTTPPYRLAGRMHLQDRLYRLDELSGRIGESDIRGNAVFDARSARNKLTAKLQSNRLALADLGATIGVGDQAAAGNARGVLPDATFDVPRMNAMDADVTLVARQVVVRRDLPFDEFRAHVLLDEGVLRLDPLNFGFAGGNLVSTVVLDARQRPMVATAAADLRRIELGRLVPAVNNERVTTGLLGAQLRLQGRGQSVAELLGSSNGTLAAAMAGGQISRVAVAAASLDGGKLLPLLFTGDQPVEIRCAALAMGVKDGVAGTQLMVGDFTTARVDGSGTIDLASEQLDLRIEVLPKKPSLLSLRAPLQVTGTFSDPVVGVGAEALMRGGAAVALAFVNPLAALLPLIETGPGEDTPCADVLGPVAGAAKQAGQASTAAPPLRPPPKTAKK